jgi:hypothetical protein
MEARCAQSVKSPADRRDLSGSRRPDTDLSDCRPRQSSFSTLCLALLIAAAAATSAFAVSVSGVKLDADLTGLPRIRTADLEIARAIRRGYDASPTMRRMIQSLQRQDVVVYLERHNRFHPGEAAHLRFAGSASGLRYVQVSLSTRLDDRDLIIFVAHELKHALEIAESEVFDEHTMRELYCRIGEDTHLGFDTRAARLVTEQVSEELDTAFRDPDER